MRRSHVLLVLAFIVPALAYFVSLWMSPNIPESGPAKDETQKKDSSFYFHYEYSK